MSTMNRLHNCRNPHQGPAKKVLCVCSAGLLRSPTTAWVLSNPPFNFNTRACGANSEYALIELDEVLLQWADEVVFMENYHYQTAVDRFPELLKDKTVIILQLPDIYEFKNPELCELITERYTHALKEIEDGV